MNLANRAGTGRWRATQHLVREIGGALFTAAFLGFTVDRASKIELIRDAFYAAFRYVLPPELKEEVAWIINYKFLCTKHYMVVTLEPIAGNDLVSVRVEIEREIKNITRHAEPISNPFSMDEGGHEGHPSKITECSVETENSKHSATDYVTPGRPDKKEKKTAEIQVASQASVKVVSVGSDVRRKRGEINLYFLAPTVNPEVLVVATGRI